MPKDLSRPSTLGYSSLTGTAYVLTKTTKRAVPENELVSVIAEFLADHDLNIHLPDGRKRIFTYEDGP